MARQQPKRRSALLNVSQQCVTALARRWLRATDADAATLQRDECHGALFARRANAVIASRLPHDVRAGSAPELFGTATIVACGRLESGQDVIALDRCRFLHEPGARFHAGEGWRVGPWSPSRATYDECPQRERVPERREPEPNSRVSFAHPVAHPSPTLSRATRV
jgi:hypothetical protein